MNVLDAAHKISHEYPGGAEALAQRMGIKPAVFRSKLNPNCSTHHLYLDESVRLQELAGRSDILHAMAEALGFVCIPAARCDLVSDEALLDAFARLVCELGDLSRVFNDSLADGRVTPREFERMRKEFYDLQQAGADLLNRVEQLVERRPEKRKDG